MLAAVGFMQGATITKNMNRATHKPYSPQANNKAGKRSKQTKHSGAFGGSRLISVRGDKTEPTRRNRAKGKAGTKLMKKAIRRYGLREVLVAMGGGYRGQRKHPGYAKRGQYTREGFGLTVPKGMMPAESPIKTIKASAK